MKNFFSFALFFFISFIFSLQLSAQNKNDTCSINLMFDYKVEDLNVTFRDLSTAYDEILWEFGDGHSSRKKVPIHQYEKTSAYRFCLTLTDTMIAECNKKFCGQVYVFDPCE